MKRPMSTHFTLKWSRFPFKNPRALMQSSLRSLTSGNHFHVSWSPQQIHQSLTSSAMNLLIFSVWQLMTASYYSRRLVEAICSSVLCPILHKEWLWVLSFELCKVTKTQALSHLLVLYIPRRTPHCKGAGQGPLWEK